jgi:phosphate-selective porin
MSASFRFIWICLLTLAISALPATAVAQKMKIKQPRVLEQVQEDYSKAIRWNDFEAAAALLDPNYREQHPITDAEFSRYEQIQVTAFEDFASRILPDGSVERSVRIDLVNRNTLSQRTIRFTERWQYDAKAKRWWLSSGLPDFWKGY